MRYINDFSDAYNTLAHLLQVVTGVSDKYAITSFIKILPPDLSADMDSIRQFRNACPGHGKKVKGEAPKAPKVWVDFLNEEIRWVDSHREEIKKKFCSLPKISSAHKIQQPAEKIEAKPQNLAVKAVSDSPKHAIHKPKPDPVTKDKSEKTFHDAQFGFNIMLKIRNGDGLFFKPLRKKPYYNFIVYLKTDYPHNVGFKAVMNAVEGQQKIPLKLNEPTSFTYKREELNNPIKVTVEGRYKIERGYKPFKLNVTMKLKES